ncbi:DUF6541 family protein [Dermabacteraceae bacterium P13088]
MAMSHLLIPSLVAIALVTIPGLLATLASGMRGTFALLLSPLASVALIGISAIVLEKANIAWTAASLWLPITGIILTLYLINILFRYFQKLFFASKNQHKKPSTHTEQANNKTQSLHTLNSLASAIVISLTLWTVHFVRILETPNAISQTFDNIYHLSAVRYMMDSGKASSLTIGGLGTNHSSLSFYPSAWHNLVSQVSLITGCEIPVATNAAAFTTASWIWTFSLLSIVWTVTSRRPITLITTGILGASFANFPIELLDFGVLYPNMLGISLVGQLGALTFLLFTGKYRSHMSLLAAIMLGLLGGIGLGLAHPNTVLVFAILSLSIMASICFTYLDRARRGNSADRAVAIGWIVATATSVVFAKYLWEVARPPFDGWQWTPYLRVQHAFGELLLQSAYHYQPAWLLSVFVAIGAAVAIRNSKQRWLVFSAVALGYLYILAAAGEDNEYRFFFVWPWYSDSARFAAQMPIVTAPLAIIGFTWTYRILKEKLGATKLLPKRLTQTTTAILLVICLGYLTQTSNHLNNAIMRAHGVYTLSNNSGLLSADEMKVLEDVKTKTPKDAVIVTDPWNGSSLAYALTGRKTTTIAPLYALDPDMDLLSQKLSNLKHDPEVCPAVNRLGASYVLAFGDPEIHGNEHDWPGLDWLQISSGFKVISRHGNAALLEITGCK